MKNFVKLAAVGLVSLVLALSLAACQSDTTNLGDKTQLSAPTNLQIANSVLTWNAVSNASGYSVQINENAPVGNGQATAYTLSSLSNGTYTIKVRANGDGIKYTDSDWSSVSHIVGGGGEPATSFTVQFDSDGGSSVPNQTITSGGLATRPADNPSKSGFVFDNWYSDSGKTVVFNFATQTITVNSTIYAKWNPNPIIVTEYTVQFSTDGGSPIANQTVTSGGFATRPVNNPTKSGYTFDNWYSDANKTVLFNFATQSITADTTVYAKWNPIPIVNYTVQFNTDGGSSIPNQTIASGGFATRPANNPTKSGYIFENWYSDAGKATVFNFATQTITSDTVIYAKWLVGNDHSIVSAENFIFNGSSASTKVSNTTTIFSFIGEITVSPGAIWQLSTDLQGLNVIPTRAINLDVGDNIVYILVTAQNGIGMSLYTMSVRRRPIYTVTFNTNGGTAVSSQQVEEDSFATNPGTTATNRTGFTFSAWNRDFGLSIMDNTTITAEWKANTYTVIYDKNKPSSISDTVNINGNTLDSTHTYNTASNLANNGYVLTGWSFKGWNTAANGSGMSYANEQSVLNLLSAQGATIRLYAQWLPATKLTLDGLNISERVSYTVSFNLNGATGTAPATQTVTNSNGLTYPAVPTRSGYVFAGWYAHATCLGEPFNFSASVTSNTTLYAKWLSPASSSITTYSSNLSINGNSGALSYSNPLVGDFGARYFSFVPLVSQQVTINATSSGISMSSSYSLCLGETIDWSNALIYSMYTFATASITNYPVIAGKLYYIRCHQIDPSGTITVSLSGTRFPPAGGIAEKRVAYGENFTLDIPNPVTGYTFSGWYDGVGGTGTQYADASGAGIRMWDKLVDATLYAKWTANEYTVTFNRMGGSGGTTSVKVLFDASMPSALVPEREHYIFDGYYDAETGGTQYYSSLMASMREWDKAHNAELFARWISITYTVELDRQGATSGTASVTAIFNSAMPTATAPTIMGYTFGGYFSEANGGGVQYYSSAMTSLRLYDKTEDTTLFAKWTASTYTVSFNASSGSGIPGIVTATYDAAMPEITVAPTRLGYVFDGFFDAVNGGTRYYNADLSSARAWNKTANTTLYARWIAITYVVRFDANGGAGSMADQIYSYGTSQNLRSNTFGKTGNIFANWSVNADGSGTNYTNGQSVSNLSSTQDTVITLYAQWHGSESKPVILQTAQGLTSFATQVNGGQRYSGIHFRLGANINLGGAEWTPIGASSSLYFGGNFDGAGFVISNYKITQAREYAGLFGYSGGTIENIGVENFTINITRSGTTYVGGLVGYNSGTIDRSYATSNITANTMVASAQLYAGGLVGYSNGVITNCYANGNVTATSGDGATAGGLIGCGAVQITNCYATGIVSATSTDIGQFAGFATAGGLVGSMSGKATNCYAKGEVNAKAGYNSLAGGLFGSMSGEVINCYALGKVAVNSTASVSSGTAEATAGGLIGSVYMSKITSDTLNLLLD
ncbi:MAG: InlB B-repeat-containing protein [Firmicutes bacterium]|nr:InlB B-repeat-containing protein [Bacillota bacterium]